MDFLSPTRASDYGHGIVRIRHSTKKDEPQPFKRGQMVRVKTPKASAYAIIMFDSDLKKDEISMEYDLSKPLTEDSDKGRSIDVSISKVPFYQYARFFRNHPNPFIRYSAKLSVYRTAMGFLGGIFSTALFQSDLGAQLGSLVMSAL